MSDDLVAFLRARLDEEKAEAEAALKRTTTTRRRVQGQWVEDTVQPPEWRRSAWSPARVLADVDGKRELIKRGDTLFCNCDFADSPPTNPEDRSQKIPHHYDCTAYRIAAVLALPYDSHPDYREEWRP